MILASCNNIKNYPGEENLAGRDTEFDLGWKFIQDSINGAEVVAFNDSGWRTIDLPHDWSIENLTVVKGDTIIGPFF